MASSEEGKTVCVTGANGYVASYVVQQLLERGYTVHGTVRNVSDPSKGRHLHALPGASERLRLFEASLSGEGVRAAFSAAMRGCSAVVHTASPYKLNVVDPQRDLVDPAVQGVENVLGACIDCGVKKVVLTSSVAAITDSPENGRVYTEEDWNTASSLERNPYYHSKARAERRAWEIAASPAAKEIGLELCAINPFMVIGPSLSPALNPSNSVFVNILTGEWPGIMDISWGIVDVRDVATAHVLALESGEAEGRYIVWNETKSMEEVCTMLAQKYPSYPVPKKDMRKGLARQIVYYASYLQPKGTGQYLRTNLGRHPQLDHSKVERLGLRFTPAEQSIFDACDDLIAKGRVVVPPPKSPLRKLMFLLVLVASPILLWLLFRRLF